MASSAWFMGWPFASNRDYMNSRQLDKVDSRLACGIYLSLLGLRRSRSLDTIPTLDHIGFEAYGPGGAV